MAIYSAGVNTTVATTTAPSLDLKASATNAPRIMEWAVNLGVATASTYGFGRPANSGSVAQTSPTVVQPDNPNDATGNSNLASTWTTAPTVPGVFVRRIQLPATQGAGVIWTFPRGFILVASGSAVMWNIAASSASTNVWAIVDE
jgi:hypothetical protein